MPTYNIDLIKENLERELEIITAIQNIVPDCIVEKTGNKKVKTTFRSPSILNHQNLTFSINREKTSIFISLFLKIKTENNSAEVYPIINKLWLPHLNLASKIGSFQNNKTEYYLTCHRENLEFLNSNLSVHNSTLLDHIYKIFYQKILDIIKKEKLVPSSDLLKVFPDLGKFVALY